MDSRLLLEREAAFRAAALVDGRPFPEYVDQVKALVRGKHHAAAIELLLRLIPAAEAQADIGGPDWPVAPWYYWQLAVVLRKERRTAEEILVLERYIVLSATRGGAPDFIERLEKLRRRNAPAG